MNPDSTTAPVVAIHRPGARPDAAAVAAAGATMPRGRFHFALAKARPPAQIPFRKARPGQGRPCAPGARLAGQTRGPSSSTHAIELITNVGNLLTRQAVRVVASLDIPDLIAAGVTEVDDLAAHVGADRDALRRLSRHLVRRGVFTQPTPSTLGLTALGSCFVSTRQAAGTSISN